MNKRIVALIATGILSTAAHADGSVGLKVGTLGIGVEGTYDLTPKWGIRGSINQYDYSYDDDLDGVDYEGDLELSSVTLLADYRPAAGGFRLTGGAVFNDNTIRGVALPVSTYDIGNDTYSIAETGELSAVADFDSVAPYVGIGYDFGASQNLRINIDAGVLFQGEAGVRIDSRGGTLSNDPAFRAELDREALAYEDDLDDYDLYPVISIGLSYVFN